MNSVFKEHAKTWRVFAEKVAVELNSDGKVFRSLHANQKAPNAITTWNLINMTKTTLNRESDEEGIYSVSAKSKEEEENSLQRLLKSDNFTLEDVLLNEFVVQDSRYGKAELVEYITTRENMKALLELSLTPQINPNLPMKQQYRLSFIASEILTIRGTDVFQKLIVTTEETRKTLCDFINDKEPLNYLVAGFFAKIMECLLSRHFSLLQTFALLQDTPFFEKCLQNIHLGAIECLLENLVRIPNTGDGTRAVKQWMIDQDLFVKMVDQMRVASSDDDRECLAEVFCEILRELRDKLYMLECKDDVLHDKAMEEELISKIADNLLIDETCSDEELSIKGSLVTSSAKILEVFIKTNFVPNSPAQHLEEVERNLIEERHYSYGLTRSCLDNENYANTYQPDPEKIVEGIVANRTFNILQTVLRDVERSGPLWQPLLRLLIELCNTNHLPTHQKLAAAFRKFCFVKLIDQAKKMPRASVLHSLLVKVVILLLHSTFPSNELSPAAEYLLSEGGLVKSVYDTAISFLTPGDLIACSGLLPFIQNIVEAISRAKRRAFANPQLLTILKADERWSELEDIVLTYYSRHRQKVNHDFNDSSLLSSVRKDSHGFKDSDEWQDATTKFAEMDASYSGRKGFSTYGQHSAQHHHQMKKLKDNPLQASRSIHVPVLERLKQKGKSTKSRESLKYSSSIGQQSQKGETLGGSLEPNLQRFSKLDGQFDDTPDEDEFRKLCSERANSSSCSGAQISFDSSASPIKWPGEQHGGETMMDQSEASDPMKQQKQNNVVAVMRERKDEMKIMYNNFVPDSVKFNSFIQVDVTFDAKMRGQVIISLGAENMMTLLQVIINSETNVVIQRCMDKDANWRDVIHTKLMGWSGLECPVRITIGVQSFTIHVAGQRTKNVNWREHSSHIRQMKVEGKSCTLQRLICGGYVLECPVILHNFDSSNEGEYIIFCTTKLPSSKFSLFLISSNHEVLVVLTGKINHDKKKVMISVRSPTSTSHIITIPAISAFSVSIGKNNNGAFISINNNKVLNVKNFADFFNLHSSGDIRICGVLHV